MTYLTLRVNAWRVLEVSATSEGQPPGSTGTSNVELTGINLAILSESSDGGANLIDRGILWGLVVLFVLLTLPMRKM